MFNVDEEKYLIRQLGRNQVVLFLGAGFSYDAKNKLGENFPFGESLAKKIWDFLSIEGEYDGTSLQELYQAFEHEGIKKNQKIDFLNTHLISGDIPSDYNAISIPFWFKIYTLNVDDIIDKVFSRNQRKIDVLRYPIDEFKERDQSLERTQIVHLNGKLPCDPENLIFSTKQYAKANLNHQPLYAQFVQEYATLPTIFLGTKLSESLFETYIEAREKRGKNQEKRPKSFLIAPEISPVRKSNLEKIYNVHFIKGTTNDFLNWLTSISNDLPNKEEILYSIFPNLIRIKSLDVDDKVKIDSIIDFAESFRRIQTNYKIDDHRSSYLLGSSPMWKDIFAERDIPRTITNDIFNKIEEIFESENNKFEFVSISGSAGSGKSTILKRLGLRLAQNGRTTFLSYSEHIPKVEKISDLLSSIDERVVLLFDNANNLIGLLPKLIDDFKGLSKLPIIVLSIRSSYRNRLYCKIDPNIVEHNDFKIPNLDDNEINDLIDKLDEFDLLGKLKGKSRRNRFQEFKYRSNKQILVAMKETTKGRPFDEIIKDEYRELEPIEAKLLTLCISLNTEIGFTNTKQDLIGFSKVSHSETLNILDNQLDGTIIYSKNRNNFMLRHRVLAEHFIKHCANLDHVKEAYIRVLSVLAPELKGHRGSSRKFSLYRALINHRTLYFRFQENIELAREVYKSISEFFSNDPHYWLQFGSLEIEGRNGNLITAENYLDQALSLSPNDNYIKNAFCNLYYKMAQFEDTFSHAFDFKLKADEIAFNQITNVGSSEPHIYQIYCKGVYEYIKKWVTQYDEKKEMMEELKKTISIAVVKHPRDNRLEKLNNIIVKTYLRLGIENPTDEDPEIPRNLF